MAFNINVYYSRFIFLRIIYNYLQMKCEEQKEYMD